MNLIIENIDFFISFLIGYIDGDGCISIASNNHPRIVIECDSSWKDVINNWFYRLYSILNIKYPNQCKITNRGNTKITVANSNVLLFLKNKTIELILPILDRKWEKIPLINLNQTRTIRNDNIMKDLQNNTPKNIGIKYGLSEDTITQIKKKIYQEPRNFSKRSREV